MKSLTFEQMESIEGGSKVLAGISCGIGIAAFGLAFAGLVTATGGTALLIAAASYRLQQLHIVWHHQPQHYHVYHC